MGMYGEKRVGYVKGQTEDTESQTAYEEAAGEESEADGEDAG